MSEDFQVWNIEDEWDDADWSLKINPRRLSLRQMNLVVYFRNIEYYTCRFL